MDLERRVGLHAGGTSVVADRKALIRYINLKLAALGQPTDQQLADSYLLDIANATAYLSEPKGTIGADRFTGQIPAA